MEKVKAQCIRECFDKGEYFVPSQQWILLDPERGCAVHFRFLKDPKVEHKNYTYNTELNLYVRNKDDGKKRPLSQLPDLPIDAEEIDAAKEQIEEEKAEEVEAKPKGTLSSLKNK